MFIHVDVEAGDNCPYPLSKSFATLGVPRQIARVLTVGQDGREDMQNVTGWSPQGPVPAYAVPVEDSGEGTVLLVYGAKEGIRLKPATSQEPWSLDDPQQWGEPCLLLAKDADIQP